METIVWSMNVIATAKIIAARIRLLELLPADPPLPPLIALPQVRPAGRPYFSVGTGSVAYHQSNDCGCPGQLLSAIGMTSKTSMELPGMVRCG
jgi:hypothetical protein